MSELALQRQRLLDLVCSFRSVAVAFSGGVDSAVLAQAAHLALGDAALAVTATSPSLADGELETAVRLASAIGIRHEILSTEEFNNKRYTRNNPDRCYHCKSELYARLDGLAERYNVNVVLNGANVDDLGDYRPGMQAATEHAVRSPLVECGFTKADVRRLARHWKLSVADKPASPCLSSRVAYGEEVTPQRLRMIDQAEQFLRQHGFHEVRVRYHRGDLARIEVATSELSRLIESDLRGEFVSYLTSLGFKCVTLDLQGFRSGSLNALVQIGAARGQQ